MAAAAASLSGPSSASVARLFARQLPRPRVFAAPSRASHSAWTSSTPVACRPLHTSRYACKLPARHQTRNLHSSKAGQQQQAPPPPPPPPPPQAPRVKFWPFLVIIALGSGSYVLLAANRNKVANMPAIEPPKTSGQLPAPSKSTPTFSGDDVTVVFVLGGPGAGKGTQCANLVRDYGFTHLSAGDLLRAEQDRPGSQFGNLIKDCIRNGAIVPMEVTVQLLENAMTETLSKGVAKQGRSRFLIDGFPRKMDQALKFEETVCPASFVLFYDCPEDEMERRLLDRGKTSGRADDNIESIRKRFRTFIETSMPVVDHYEKEGRVVKVDARPKPDAVYADTQKRIAGRLDK